MFVLTKKIITLNSELWKVPQTVKTLFSRKEKKQKKPKVENTKMRKDRCWEASNIVSNIFQYKAKGGKKFKVQKMKEKWKADF